MAATVKVYGFNGAGPSGATVDSGDSASFKLGRDDLLVSSSPVPIPTATGTHFSYVKWLALDVTATSSTSISNLRVNLASSISQTGLSMWYGTATVYTAFTGQQGTVAGDYPSDAGTNGATPQTVTNISAWAAMPTTATQYDSGSFPTSSTGAKGKYVCIVGGVDDTFTLGGGSQTLPNVVFTYDEA